MSQDTILTTITPEEGGLPSGAVLGFLEHISEKQLCLHGFIILRQGKILAEGYVPPFNGERLHRMYSISKTFVSAAVGLALGEGRLALDDRIVSFFPELLPENLNPLIAAVTVRDLLVMATPFDVNTYGRHDADWVRSFFHASASHAPGSIFTYNTGATVVLNALVEKLVGESLLDYMRSRLLDPIGFSPEARCILRPEGGCWGGSGVLCTGRDLAKFALVFLNRGRWQGQQLLPESYVDEAISKQIDTTTTSPCAERTFGYGYQIWRTRHNGFAMAGLGGQYAVCLPDHDCILITLADTQINPNGIFEIIDGFWDHVYPFLSASALPEDTLAQRQLEKACASLRLPLLHGMATSPRACELNGLAYEMDDNPMKISHVCFRFEEKHCQFHYRNATGEHTLTLAFQGYAAGIFPENHYYGAKMGTPADRGYACMASASWLDERTLLATVYITDDYLGTLRMQFSFGEGQVSVLMTKAAEWFLDEYEGFGFGRVVEIEGWPMHTTSL